MSVLGGERLAPTRLNLLRAARSLGQVARGTALLRRKREALVRELFRLAGPAVDSRIQIATAFVEGYRALLGALAIHGRTGLRAIAWPERTLSVRLEPGSVWGVNVTDISERPTIARVVDTRGVAPALTGPTTSDAARRFEALAEHLLDVAAAEQRIRRIGDAVARESRQLRTLEQRVAPRLERQMAVVERTLQEREREEYLRLKHLQRRRTRTHT
jgi:V/A-type H+-transporting ATPase subunit D